MNLGKEIIKKYKLDDEDAVEYYASADQYAQGTYQPSESNTIGRGVLIKYGLAEGPSISQDKLTGLNNSYSKLRSGFNSYWDKDSISNDADNLKKSIAELRKQNSVGGVILNTDLEDYLQGLEDYVGYVGHATSTYDKRADYNRAVREANYYNKYVGKSDADLWQAQTDLLVKHGGKRDEEYNWIDSYLNSDERQAEYTDEEKLYKNTLAMIRNDARLDTLNRENAAQQKQEREDRSWMDYVGSTFTSNYQNPYSQDYASQIAQTEREREGLMRERYDINQAAKYDSLKNETDFAKKSKFDPTITDETYRLVMDSEYRANTEDLIRKAKVFGGNTRSDETGFEHYDYLTDEERANFSYLWHSGEDGPKQAKEYLQSLKLKTNEQRMNETREAAKMLGGSWASGIPASIISVPYNLASGIGAISATIQSADNTRRVEKYGADAYRPVDYNSAAFTANAMASGIREGGAERWGKLGTIHIDKDKNPVMAQLFDGKGFGDVYQLGMSMADSAAIAALSPVLGGTGTILLGGSAATQGMLDAVEKGATDSQAVMMGLFNGVFEALFEEVSLEHLTKGLNFKHNILNLLTQGGVEGSEELSTSIANLIAESAIMADKSDISKETQRYIEEGLSPDEARKQAIKDKATEILWDFVGGLASGGLMGVGFSNISHVATNTEYRKMYSDAESVKALIDEALELNPDNKLANKLKNNKKLRGGQAARLVQMNEQAIQSADTQKIQNAAESRLAELGETGDVKLIASAVSKTIATESLGEGEINLNLTKDERQALKGSEYAQRVLNELRDTEGQYAGQWANDLGTDKVNTARFNLNDKVKSIVAERYDLDENTANIVEKAATEQELTAEEQKLVNDDAVEMFRSLTEYPSSVPVVEKAVSSQKYRERVSEAVKPKATEQTVSQTTKQAETTQKTARSIQASEKAVSSPQTKGFQNLLRMKNATQDEVLFENSMRHVYELAQTGMTEEQVRKSSLVGNLTDSQITAAWTEGHDHPISKATPKTRSNKTSGKISAVGMKLSELRSTFNDTQKTAYQLLDSVAKATGLNIVLYQSQLNNKGQFTATVNGRETTATGMYMSSDNNTLYIDVNAGLVVGSDIGDLAKYTMVRTFTHEFVHFIENWSSDAYNELRQVVFKYLDDPEAMIDKVILNSNRKMSYDDASREVVAEALVDILPQTEFITDLYENHQNIFQKLWQQLKDFIANLKSHLASLGETTEQARAVKRQFGEAVQYAEDIVKAFDKAAKSAVENMNRAGIAVDEKANYGSISNVQESVRYLLDDKQRAKTVAALAERFGVTEQEAESWLKSETSLASLITNPKYSSYLDYEADPTQEAIKKNSDYAQGTVDFSNICAKRRELTMVMNRILRQFPYQVFLATDLAKIRTIMEQEGFNVPCAICYVEDRRQRDTIVAKGFIDDLQRYRNGETTNADGKKFGKGQIKAFEMVADDDYTPSVYELASLEGLNALKEKDEAMERAWRTYNNARGMASINLPLNDAEYKRQILKYTAKQVKAKNDLGGLRIYSYSDLEMFHLIDIIQVITDAATVGLSIQGYTKVNEYAKAVKDTGLKLNRSLIPKGDLGYHIEDGKVVLDFDTKEGIDINHPDFFDSKDNANIGNILIGINPEQIRAAMVSDFVDMIIPFHTGQSKSVLREKGIDAWQNYKDSQTEKDLATGTVSDHQINIYTEVLQVLEREGKEINKRSFVKKFLEVCKENNLKPRFAEFLNVDANGDYVYTEGYHKFLVDFKTFAQTEVGEYLPQMPVKPIFDDAYTTQILKDYVKSQKVKDADIAKKMPTVIDRITDEIVKADETVQYQSRVTPEQDAEYLELAKDPEGNKAKLDSIVEQAARAAGYDSPRLYHATDNEFWSFDREYLGKNTVGNATDEYWEATAYIGFWLNTQDVSKKIGAKKADAFYATIQNPLELGSVEALVELCKEHSVSNDAKTIGKEALEWLRSEGYDGITLYDEELGGKSWVVFDNTQIKSADPVTYDDDGNVIPLSERFNSENDDIRYQERVTPEQDAEHLELAQEINNAGLVLTSQNNNKNNQRINAWIKENHPDLYGRVQFENDKTTGTVTVKRILQETVQERDARANSKAAKAQADREKYGIIYGDDDFQNTGLIRNFNHRDAVAQAVEDRLLSNPHFTDVNVHKSGGMGSYETFYVTVTSEDANGDSRSATARFSNHDSRYGGADIYLWNNAYDSVSTLLDDIERKLEDNLASENPTKNDDIRYQERTETITNRDLLVSALDSVAGTEQKKILEDYKAKLDSLNEKSAQLADIRKQMHDIMFTKGSDRSELTKLTNQANILEKQIARADKTLTKVEAMEPMKNLIEVEKKKAQKRQAEKGRQRLENYREGRNKTEVRQNIHKVVNELASWMEKPSETKHVPTELIPSVVALMEAIDTTTPRTLKDGTVKEMSASAKAQADALYALYSSLKEEYNGTIYNETILNELQSMRQAIGDTPVNDMTLDQLNAVYRALRAVRKIVKDSVKVKWEEFTKNTHDTGVEMIRETRDAMPLLKGKMSEYLNAQLSPDRFFERLGGYKKDSEWAKVGHMFSAGTKKSLEIQRDFYYMFKDISETKGFIDSLNNYSKKNLVDIGLVDRQGNHIEITRGMMLSIFMHLANAENTRGFFYGGFKVPNLKQYYNNGGATSYDADLRAYTTESVKTGDSLSVKLAEIDELVSKRTELKARRAELTARVEATSNALKKQTERLAELKSEQSKLNKQGEDTSEVKAQIKEAKAQIQALTKQLEQDKQARDTSPLKAQIKELTDRIDAKEAEADAIEASGMKAIDKMRQTIWNQMTPTEKALIERAHEWYDVKSRGYINETTMDLYDIEKANVKNYYSIHRDPNFLSANFENIARDMSLENWGALKERVPSDKPIWLTDIMFEMDNHVQNLAKFVGYARATRDFNMLYNTNVGSRTNRDSVQNAVANVFGGKPSGSKALLRTGGDYIAKFLEDIVGGKTQPNMLGVFRGYVARGSLTLNPRVAFSQLASIPTASAEVGWGSMARGFAKALPGIFSHNAKEELASKSVYFWQRYRGEGGMREFSEARGDKTALDRLWNKAAKTKVGSYLLNWCQDFDVMATYSMWSMAEDWVDHNTDLRRGTAEYDKAVEDKYDAIIRKTQPNYTVTERSDMLRNKSEMVKTFTMFKTQPNQNFNILYEATAEARKYRKDFKAGKNGVTAADVKAANAKLANAYTGVILGGGVAFVAFRALANVLLQSISYLRDDDDEITAKSVAEGLFTEFASALSGMFLYGGQIADFITPLLTGGNYYGPSDAALSLIGNLTEQSYKIAKKALDPNKKVEKSDYLKEAKTITTAFGLPWSNIEKMVKGVGYWIEDVQDGTLFEASADRTNSVQYNRLFKALDNKDKFDTVYDEMVKTLTASGKTEKEAESLIKSNLKKRAKQMFTSGEITEQQAVDMLANHAIFGMSKDEAYWAVKEWAYDQTKDDDDANFSEYGELYDALTSGQGADVAYKTMLDHGYTKEQISTQVRKKAKEWYESGEINEQQAKTILTKYTNTEDVNSTVGGWSFSRRYGISYDDRKQAYYDGTITRKQLIDAMVEKGKTVEQAETEATLYDWQKMGYDGDEVYDINRYKELAEPTGIPVNTYIDFCNNIRNVSGYKQEDKLPLIDRLPLTTAQKDALWYCCGWAESTLYKKAPWH